MRAIRPSAPRRSVSRRTAARRALSVVGAASLVVVPAAAAIAADDAPAEPSPDATQPATPEVTLPSPDQVDQIDPAPSPAADAAPSEAAPVPEPAAPVSAAPVSAAPAATDDLSAATPPPGAYFGTGKVQISVVPQGAAGADLTSRFLVTADDGETAPAQQTITTEADGRYDPPYGYAQVPGDELTITLVDAPAGYMLPENATQVVPACVVPVTGEPAPPGAECEVSLTFTVVPDYRTVAARTRTAGGTAVAGVTVELHSPDAGAPSPSPIEPMPSALPADGAALDGDLAAVTIPGRTLIATGVTDANGRVVFDEPVTPAQGYLLVPTQVPDGYLLPAAVSVDVPAVATVAEANLALDVPITMVPRAVTPGGPGGPGATVAPVAPAAVVTPPRYTGATLPDTGVDAIALTCLAGLFVAAGAASVVGSRRAGTRA